MKKLVLLFVAIIAVAFKIYVLTTVWGWFIVPLGVQQITYLHAAGLIGFCVLITHQYSDKDETDDEIAKRITDHVVTIFFVWGISFIIHYNM